MTVKDIVDECRMPRQTFYNRFEDISTLLRWILGRDSEPTILETKFMKNGEEKLRYLIMLAIDALAHMKKGLETGYRCELGKLLTQHITHLFEQLCDEGCQGLKRGLLMPCSCCPKTAPKCVRILRQLVINQGKNRHRLSCSLKLPSTTDASPSVTIGIAFKSNPNSMVAERRRSV